MKKKEEKILSPIQDTGSILTPEEKKKDINNRMEAFRKAVEVNIKEFQVGIEAQIQMTNRGIVPVTVLNDLKFNEDVQEHKTNN